MVKTDFFLACYNATNAIFVWIFDFGKKYPKQNKLKKNDKLKLLNIQNHIRLGAIKAQTTSQPLYQTSKATFNWSITVWNHSQFITLYK